MNGARAPHAFNPHLPGKKAACSARVKEVMARDGKTEIGNTQ
jgi:hypothetical protein